MTIEAPDRTEPTTIAGALVIVDAMKARADDAETRLAAALQEIDGLRVELDNAMQHNIDLARLVQSYAVSEGMWHAARDEAVEKYDEARDQRDEAHVRIDELQAELDDVRGAR